VTGGRLLTVAAALLSLTAASAFAATPSRRDSADAHAYYRAATSFSSSLTSAVSTVPGRIERQLAGCPSAFSGASAVQVDEARGAAADLEVFRAIMPRYAAFSRALDARHAQSAVLRRLSAAVAVINGQVQKYARVHENVCTLGSEWQAQGWQEGFTDGWLQQLDSTAGANASVLTAAERRVATLKGRLLRLGLTAKQAGDLVGFASLS
jgi:hypothetical protein